MTVRKGRVYRTKKQENSMTVRELIAELQKFDGDKTVLVNEQAFNSDTIFISESNRTVWLSDHE